MITWFSRKKKTTSQTLGKDDFVSLSSHELRAPLSIIKWYTEILLDGDAGPITDEQRKYLTTIETSNQRAIDLTRSLLNVSRLDLDTFSVSPEELSIPSIITEAISLFSKDASKKEVGISCEEKDSVPKIEADKHICLLVIKQLLLNAINFSHSGDKVLVTSSLAFKNSTEGKKVIPETSILVTVTDTGIGIPNKDKDEIFSKMFKASNVTDNESTGSGLGLYIAKTTMQIVGGDIWFTSEEGKGSTFYVLFPVKGMKKKVGRTVLD